MPVSATLAANEALASRRRLGQPVLPLAFGEAGLPVLPALRDALSAAAGLGAYGPVAGLAALREAAAGYWDRRGGTAAATRGQPRLQRLRPADHVSAILGIDLPDDKQLRS